MVWNVWECMSMTQGQRVRERRTEERTLTGETKTQVTPSGIAGIPSLPPIPPPPPSSSTSTLQFHPPFPLLSFPSPLPPYYDSRLTPPTDRRNDWLTHLPQALTLDQHTINTHTKWVVSVRSQAKLTLGFVNTFLYTNTHISHGTHTHTHRKQNTIVDIMLITLNKRLWQVRQHHAKMTRGWRK